MEPIFKELTRLESLSVPSSSSSSSSSTALSSSSKKAKSSSSSALPPAALSTTLDRLIRALEGYRNEAARGEGGGETPEEEVSRLKELLKRAEKDIGESKERVDEAIKGWHKAIGKVATTIDKALPPSVPITPTPHFANDASKMALDQAILLALTRRGQSDVVATFRKEAFGEDLDSMSGVEASDVESARRLRAILNSIRAGDLQPAIDWCDANVDFLTADPPSPLAFYLHRAYYLSLLLSPPLSTSIVSPRAQGSSSSEPPSRLPRSLLYAQTHFPAHYALHGPEIRRLLTAQLFSPAVTAIPLSPYKDLVDPALRAPLLVPLFEAEFCRKEGWPEREPVGLAVDLGASAAVAKIEKGRKVMKERVGKDWEMGEELPMEIPLPSSLRFHSIFACPVSKTLATPQNPPMMLVCGHTVARESFGKLGKGSVHRLISRTVKCPYCPVETPTSSALELHF